MESTDYILLFEKFLRKQASAEEVNLLIQWLKSESLFSSWADDQWEAVTSDIDPALQRKLLGKIKASILPEEQSYPLRPTGKSISVFRWAVRVAAIFLLLLSTGIGVYYYTQQQVMPDTIVGVEKGQKASITLPDGSRVWINSDSKLSYGSRFNTRERVLNLEGEAYFEVTQDKDRPFIVQTNEMAVQALGTSFDVKSYPNETQASAVLMTGKVEITSGSGSLILEPNEKLVYNKTTRKMGKSEITDALTYSDWKDNTLSFHGETFENIAHALERYYNTRIVFESDSLKKYRFTGSPGNTSLESLLQILSLTSPLSYEVKDSLILLRENIQQKAWYEKALK